MNRATISRQVGNKTFVYSSTSKVNHRLIVHSNLRVENGLHKIVFDKAFKSKSEAMKYYHSDALAFLTEEIRPFARELNKRRMLIT